MTRTVNIEWPDFKTTVAFTLSDEENPKMCEGFWRGLPFETVFAGSMSAGEMFKVPFPYYFPVVQPLKMVFLPEEPPGTIVVSRGGTLLVNYGAVIEPFRLPLLGRIPKTELGSLLQIIDKVRDAYWFTKVTNKAIFKKAQ